MENQEHKETGEKPATQVQIACTDRTRAILQEVLIPNQKDPFCRITTSAAVASGSHNLPVNITMTGNPEAGRVSIVSNALITMITMEMVDSAKTGGEAPTCIGTVARFTKEGGAIEDDAEVGEDEGNALLQMTIGNQYIHEIAAALIRALGPTFSNATREYCVTNYHETDDDEGPVDPPIPFPAKSDVGTGTEQ